MSLVLLNSESNQQFKLDNDKPLIIGRSNVIGCVDKRVSRSHGKITSLDDRKVHVVALHSNPCFFTRKSISQIHTLNRDEEETLEEGDSFGLLPNAYWFKITAADNVKIKTESRSADEKTSFVLEQCASSSTLSQPESSRQSDDKLLSPELEKTRKLPLWMYEIDEPKKSDESPGKRQLDSGNDSVKKKTKNSSETELKETITVKNDEEIPSTSRTSGEGIPTLKQENECSKSPSLLVTKEEESSKKKEGYENKGKDPSATSRPICQYEANCYRQNPQHKLEYSHPGDSDYISYEDRPVCQYGADCYRKNIKHKTEYRHPPATYIPHPPPSPSSSSCSSVASSPLPAKRRRKPVKKQTDDDLKDDYDLEDPFINDATSDEYVPSESEDDLDTSLQDE